MAGSEQKAAMPASGRIGGITGRVGVLWSSRRTMLLAALGAVLVWLILRHSLAAYLAETAPELALSFNSSQPVALTKLVETRLNPKAADAPPTGDETASQAGTEGRLAEFASAPPLNADPDAAQSTDGHSEQADVDGSTGDERAARAQTRALAERVLAADPLNARALRMLAQVAETDGDEAASAELMEAAARRSLRETAAVHFMMRRSFAAGDYIGALDHADTILRTAPGLSRFVVPTLARMAENAETRPLLEQRLAANPPWRAMVLSALPGAVTDARTPLDLLLGLRETESPPTAADLRGYINLLIRHGYFELAYYAWLQFLPPEQLASAGLLFNGDFQYAPSGLPFDWRIASGSGAAVQLMPAAGLQSGRALRIEFGHGRVNFGHVQQTVLLAPGSYRFAGRYRGDLAGRRGLVWRIACAGKKRRLLAQSPMIMGQAPTWEEFEVGFTVPESECPAQQVQLTHDARSASERFISGAAWIAGLGIVRE